MAELQIALVVVGINIGVLSAVLFAAYLFNRSVRQSSRSNGPL